MTFDRPGRPLRLVDHLPDHKVQVVSTCAFEEEELGQPVLLPPRLGLPAASLRLKLGHVGDGLVLADDEVATSAPSCGTTTPKLVKDGSMPQMPMPSLGSALHSSGACKPCSWFWKSSGCGNGFECTHCHLCLGGELRRRKKVKDLKRRGLDERHAAGGKVAIGGEHATPLENASQDQFEQGADHGISLCKLLLPALPPPAPAEQPALLLSIYPAPSQSFASRAEVEADALPEEEGLPLCQFEPKSMTEFECGKCCRSFGYVLCTCPPDLIGFRWKVLDLRPQELRCQAEVYHPLPSPGSVSHLDGTCSPCAWYWKPQGCANAMVCHRCHLCPEGEVKKRKKDKLLRGLGISQRQSEITDADVKTT